MANSVLENWKQNFDKCECMQVIEANIFLYSYILENKNVNFILIMNMWREISWKVVLEDRTWEQNRWRMKEFWLLEKLGAHRLFWNYF